ncbi:MAG: hypothetical protein ACO4CS_20875 [bacterium]
MRHPSPNQDALPKPMMECIQCGMLFEESEERCPKCDTTVQEMFASAILEVDVIERQGGIGRYLALKRRETKTFDLMVHGFCPRTQI